MENNNNSMAVDSVETESTKTKPATHALEHLKDLQNRILSNSQPASISTGFSQLDQILGGGLFAGLYFLGGLSSLGKTTLAGQIADQIAATGQDVLIFSLEMSSEELLVKNISRLTGVIDNKGYLTTRQLLNKVGAGRSLKDEDTINKAFSVYERIAKHIFIHEGVGDISVADVRAEVEDHIAKTERKPVVIIDYLQILAPCSAQCFSDKQNIDQTVLKLKQLSRDLGISIIGISSLNRNSYDGPINMSAFKESGAIEYSADVLLGLQFEGVNKANKDFDIDAAKCENPRKIELKVLKNRNGPTGRSDYFDYYPAFNLFEERHIKSKANIPPHTLDQFAEDCLADDSDNEEEGDLPF